VTRRVTATFLFVLLFVFALAPIASAGLIGDVTDGVGDTLGGGEGSSGDSASDGDSGSGSSDPIGGTIGGVTDILDGDDSSSGDSGDSGGSGPIKKLTDGLKDTVDDTKEEADDATSDPSGYVGGITDSVDETVKDTKKKLKEDKKKSSSGDPTPPLTTLPDGGYVAPQVRNLGLAAALERDSRRIRLASEVVTAPVVHSDPPGLIAEIGRVAAAAAEQVAFPLALALMVGAFLMVQNRIDRRDPKLALAPIDTDHETLTFS